MATTEKSINQQFEKLTLSDELKYDDELLDDALINGMKGEHKTFCLQVERFLNAFLAENKTTDILRDLDKYQRKIVHKICDIYRVKRDYVDVKANDKGDITITKTAESKLPAISLEERYKRHLEEIKKQAPKQIINPIANKKLLIKPKENKKTGSELESDSSDASNENTQADSKESHDELERKKQREYEKAREKIMQEQQPSTNTNPKVIEKPKKKGLRVDQTYDPDYDRNKAIPTYANQGFYPPQFNMYYYQGYNQSQMPFVNGFQPGYGAPGMVIPEDNRFGYPNNFPALSGNNSKKK